LNNFVWNIFFIHKKQILFLSFVLEKKRKKKRDKKNKMKPFTIEDPDTFFREYKEYKYYTDIDDNTILSLAEARAFKNNGYINLKGSTKITSKLFKFLVNQSYSSDIKTLELEKLHIDDKSFSVLSRSKLMKLTTLILKDCQNIGSKGLVDYFSSKFAPENLTKVYLKNLPIDDTVILSLINNSPKIRNLEEMSLSNCEEITGIALKFLITDNFKNIMRLKLSNIKISDEALITLSTSPEVGRLMTIKLKSIKEATTQGTFLFFFFFEKEKNNEKITFIV
jgi:hypothetical protein